MLWTTQTGSVVPTGGVNTANSGAINFNSGAANTKGSWTELITSTAYTSYGLFYTDRSSKAQNSNNFGGLIDVGIGGSGSESVIVPNLVTGFNQGGNSFFLPILIPAGSRISARAQNASATQPNSGVITLQPSHVWPVSGRATDYGSVTASSGGTAMPSGTLAANTKSAWQELVSSTTYPIRYVLPMIGGPNASSWSGSVGTSLVDIGVGASGSETVVVPNLSVSLSSSEIIFVGQSGAWLDIPVGSRIAARWQTSQTNPGSTDAVRVSVIGFG